MSPRLDRYGDPIEDDDAMRALSDALLSIRHRCHDFADTARPRITFGIFAGIDYTATTRRASTDAA
jgi:hypothetical protein